jgi:hypothetical protein
MLNDSYNHETKEANATTYIVIAAMIILMIVVKIIYGG